MTPSILRARRFSASIRNGSFEDRLPGVVVSCRRKQVSLFDESVVDLTLILVVCKL